MLLALWLPLIAITIFTGCKKTSSTLAGPYEVRNYNNNYQFGGLVNGVEFLPYTEKALGFGVDPIDATLWQGSGITTNFQCNVRKLEYKNGYWNKWHEVEFYISNFQGIGNYQLNQNTNFYGFTTTPKSYGGFTFKTDSTGSKEYYITNNNADTGSITCKRWISTNDFEFEFKYTSRKVYGFPTTDSVKTISGTIIRKP